MSYNMGTDQPVPGDDLNPLNIHISYILSMLSGHVGLEPNESLVVESSIKDNAVLPRWFTRSSLMFTILS